MAVSANKRSIMTLFSDKLALDSHQTRIVLAEKGVAVDINNVEPNALNQELLELNPYGTVPTLVDRELVLYEADIIMEYLDERFPHPPLMPVYPVDRAKNRLMMHRIRLDWYSLANNVLNNAASADADRSELQENLISVAPLFAEQPFFMNEEFSLVDCYLAPLLWRLPLLNIELKGASVSPILDYMDRVFSRKSFNQSLTEYEREIHSK